MPMRLFWKTTTLIMTLALLCGLVYLYDRAEYAGAGWAGWVREQYPDSMAKKNAALRLENEQLRRDNERLPEARERLRLRLKDARTLAGRFPEGDDAAALEEGIREHAVAAGVSTRQIQFHAAAVPGDGDMPAMTVWRYSLFVQGSYAQLADFIGSLEHSGDEVFSDDSEKNWPYFEITDLNVSGSIDPRNCRLAVFTYRPVEKWLPDVIPLSAENLSPSP